MEGDVKKKDVKIGGVYAVKVSGSIVPVCLEYEASYVSGGWIGKNLLTKRRVRIRSAARLRWEIVDPCCPSTVKEVAA